MDAYIEKESLLSLIKHREDERYDECKRMLKRDLCIHFTFSKEEAFANPLIQSWVLAELTSGTFSHKPKWSSDYPDPEEELTTSGMTVEKLCAVYLLDDEYPQQLSNAMLIGHYGHELDTLIRLFVDPNEARQKYNFSVHLMKNWETMRSYVTPCTDLLIVDRYILSNRFLLERNLYKLIKIFVSNTKSYQINIVIVVENDSIDAISLDEVSEKIKTFVSEIVGEEPFVSFVLCRKSSGNALVHDRCILTNYRYVDSGDSFNYFDSNGSLKTGGFKLSVLSLAESYDYVQRIINDEVLYKIRRDVKNAVNIYGDKKSNFLKF